MIKTLYRNSGIYGKLGVHRPKQADNDLIRDAQWSSGSGEVLPGAFKTKQLFSDYTQDNYKLTQINHYALGAVVPPVTD
jgi:hypothetical protein